MNYRNPIALLFCFLLLIAFAYKYVSSDDNVQGKKSAAYGALQFQGARMAYPDVDIPSDGYTKAWNKLQSKNTADKSNVPLPHEPIGPLNRAGRMLTMAINPLNSSSMFAGSASGGLWRSSSAGEGVDAWKRVELGFPILAISSITYAFNDTMTIFVGTGEVYNVLESGTGAAYRSTRGSWGSGILKSEDGGVTWKKSLDWSLNQKHGVWAIKMISEDKIFVATTDGVYYSEDAGDNWNKILDTKMATDIVVKANEIVVACGNFETEGYGIYKSYDFGLTWEKKINGLPQVYRGKAQFGQGTLDPKVLYASIGNGFSSTEGATWLCRSNDFGSTWEIVNTQDYSIWQGWFAHNVAVSPTNNDEIVAIGIEVHKSTDGGAVLDKISSNGGAYSNPPLEGPDGGSKYIHSDSHDVVYDPNDSNTIYVVNDGGIHKSTSGGDEWHSVNGGFQTAQFYNGTSVSQVNNEIYFGGLQDNGTILWNGDKSWSKLIGGDGSWTGVHPTEESILFASTQRLNVLKSNNGGTNFGAVSTEGTLSPTCFIAPFIISPSNGQTVYLGSSKIAKSTDLGETSFAINDNQQLDGNPPLSMAISSTNENVLYVATAPYSGNKSNVFLTKDGNMFENITQNLPDRYPMDLHVDSNDDAVAYIAFSGFGSGHVFKTQDYGNSWLDITADLPDVPTNAVITDPENSDHIYVGNDFGVFLSINGGETWEPYMDGMPEVAMVFDLQIANTSRKLHVATHGNGAYRRDLFEEVPTSIEYTTENSFDVYPNPSTGKIVLNFEKDIQSNIDISLFNMQGELIDQKLNFFVQNNSSNLDLEHIETGNYVLRISLKDEMIYKQIVIVEE